MAIYEIYPAVDEGYNFPPEIRQALASSPEIGSAISVELSDKVEPIVAEYIATEPAIVDAAAAAVNANPKIAAIEADVGALEETAPKKNSKNTFGVQDKTGAKSFGTTPDGGFLIGTTEYRHTSDNHPSAKRLMDREGRVIVDIRRDGNVFMGPREVHLFIAAGQSNMSGRGLPVGAEYDVVDQRLLQYGSKNRSLIPATVPLDMHDSATGLSPATVFAREYLKNQPAHVSVLLVPAAHGGTAFTSASPLTWSATDPLGLYSQMLQQVDEAIAESTALYGSAPKLKGLLWHQGEGDAAALNESQYSAQFDALANGLRTHLGLSTLPVIVGEMSPDWTLRNTVANGVMASHIQTPARLARAAFAYGPPNTGNHNDDVHYSRTGVQRLGENMYAAYFRSLVNVTGVPAPPPNVSAVRIGEELTVSWEQAPSRVSSYIVEYQVDGGVWIVIPSTTPALSTTRIANGVVGSKISVRVSTVNDTGTSASTRPIYAIGA